MRSVIVSLLVTLRATLRDRAAMRLEILALRHQLHVINRSRPQRLRLTHADRMLWVWLSKRWNGWRAALVIVRPETVLAWHRRGFRLFWTWKSRHRVGRPGVPPAVRQLIRTMAEMNPLWGAPRINGELLKLGIDVSQATVAKYMPRHRRPPSQTWRTFLTNHVGQIMAADFFVVPTATCRLLFVLVILAHQRRRVVHVAVTAHPTAAWTAQQLREAFPGDEVPRYLIRDRDHAFAGIGETAIGMGIHEVLTASRSPWQHGGYQLLEIRRYRWWARCPGLPPPEEAESFAVPTDQGVRLHDRERGSPVDQPCEHDEDDPRRIIGTAGFDSALRIEAPAASEESDSRRPAATAIESRATRA